MQVVQFRSPGRMAGLNGRRRTSANRAVPAPREELPEWVTGAATLKATVSH